MIDDDKNKEDPKKTDKENAKPLHFKKPDELSGLNIEAKFKIFDPETGKIIVQGRA